MSTPRTHTDTTHTDTTHTDTARTDTTHRTAPAKPAEPDLGGLQALTEAVEPDALEALHARLADAARDEDLLDVAYRVVDTPIGPYNPDWAIVFEDTERVYLVRETKGSLDPDQRRHEENVKIECARRHFSAIGVDYDVASDASEMFARLAEGG